MLQYVGHGFGGGGGGVMVVGTIVVVVRVVYEVVKTVGMDVSMVVGT